MKIAIFEDNLIWSGRFKIATKSVGHEPAVFTQVVNDLEDYDVAIVNLGSKAYDVTELIPKLQEMGIKVLAHAGHKEKNLLEIARNCKADRIATNGEITHKLPQILIEMTS